jgi:hypothetical protein
MKQYVIFALLCAAGICAAAAPDLQAKDPRIGYWIEDRISAAYPQAQGLQVSVEDLGGGRFRYTIGANHLPENMLRVEGKCDGGRYTFVDGNGKSLGNTLSCRYSGAHAVDYLYTQAKADTWLTSTGSESVSEDGSRMTWKATRRDANGRVVEELSRQFSRRP